MTDEEPLTLPLPLCEHGQPDAFCRECARRCVSCGRVDCAHLVRVLADG